MNQQDDYSMTPIPTGFSQFSPQQQDLMVKLLQREQEKMAQQQKREMEIAERNARRKAAVDSFKNQMKSAGVGAMVGIAGLTIIANPFKGDKQIPSAAIVQQPVQTGKPTRYQIQGTQNTFTIPVDVGESATIVKVDK